MNDSEIFIIGANGQLGTALRQKYPGAKSADISELDITDSESVETYDWSGIKVILNAAAYTNVDGAETTEGRVMAWGVNAAALKNIVYVAWKNKITIVHISTDYVFDGTIDNHQEDESFSPLSVYGASKAAGDLIIEQLDQRYILRTSWVIGEGKNFVRTMLGLGQKGVSPAVVADQVGRLTFASTLVDAIHYLLSNNCQFGTYNVSNSGQPASWADVTREIFKLANFDLTVTDTTTAEYFKDKPGTAPRPLSSTLDLSKIEATGFHPTDWLSDLESYVKKELAK